MRPAQSHGWLSFANVAALVLIPASVTLAGGIWLTGKSAAHRLREAESTRMQEVTARTRNLVDGVRDALEAIRLRALGVQQSPALLGGPILYWAELELGDRMNVLSIRRELRNEAWDVSAKELSEGGAPANRELQASALKMRLEGMAVNGVVLTSYRTGTPGKTGSREWVSLVFPTGQAGTAVLAVVDPLEAFPVFRRWGSRSEGGAYRAYWVNPEGRVVAHSLRSYQGADFSRLPVFDGALKELMGGNRVSGVGIFAGLDRMNALTGYSRPDNLPMALVVEKAEIPGPPWSWLVFREMTAGLEIAWLALAWLAITSSLLVAWLLRRGLVHTAESIEERKADLRIDLDAELPSVATPDSVLFENGEFARIAASFAAAPISAPAGPESDGEQDSATTIARQLTELAYRICGSPALFFAHHPQARSAILQATSLGTPENQDSIDAAFPILDGLRKDLARQEPRGIMPLRDYLPLSQIISRHFQTTGYQAWVVTGLAEGSARLLGILVLLKKENLEPEQHDSMIQLIRGTAAVYENSLGK